MAIKKLKLTEDHIALIRSLDFHCFAMGEKYRTSKLDNCIEDLTECKEKVEGLISAYEQNEKIEPVNMKLAMEQEVTIKTSLEAVCNARKEMQHVIDDRSKYSWGIDQWSPWGGYVYTDIARRIGRYDEVIKGTENDTTGAKFPEELTLYMDKLYDDIIGNLPDVLNLCFQFMDKGGLTPGTYKCINYQGVWEKVEE